LDSFLVDFLGKIRKNFVLELFYDFIADIIFFEYFNYLAKGVFFCVVAEEILDEQSVAPAVAVFFLVLFFVDEEVAVSCERVLLE